jgi:hypothetical protein
MATNETPSTDLVVLDADPELNEDMSFGREVAKTLAVSTATSAGVFGLFVVTALVAPKVKSWFDRKKNNEVVIEGESSVKDSSDEK